MAKTGRMTRRPDKRPDKRPDDAANGGLQRRRRADRRGRFAEFAALVYFCLTLHRILAWRWRGPAGEIDLVARRGRTIIFCEVKYRHAPHVEAVPSAYQRRRIAGAARQFCQQRRISPEFELRFDLIQISPSFGGIIWRFRQLRNAWWATPDRSP